MTFKPLLLLVLSFFLFSMAQGQIRVKGKVLDSATGEPIKDVTVSAFNLKDTALINFTFTTVNGNYYMEINHPDSILVTFSYFTYFEQSKIFKVMPAYYFMDHTIKMAKDARWNTLSKLP